MSSKGKNIQDIYTLTPMQEGMLFHALYDSASAAYFEQVSYRLHGDLDISSVEKSLNYMFERYDILRTAFVHEGVARPVQVVLRNRKADFHYEDFTQKGDREEKEALIRQFKKKDRERSFDLVKDTLMRVAVIRVTESEYEFIWSHHHILMDGWCTGIMISGFFQAYNAFTEGQVPQMPPVTPYRKYIEWIERQDKKNARNYWAQYLDGYEETTGVPRSQSIRDEAVPYKKERLILGLKKDTTEALEKIAADNLVTVNILTQAVWGIVLSKYNNNRDVVFGAVVSGRPPEIDGVETMVGLFINTLPIRVRYEEGENFLNLLERLRNDNADSQPNQYFPLPEIQANTPLKHRLMDHIIVFENFPVEKQIEDQGKQRDREQAVQPSQKQAFSLKMSNVDSFEQINYDFSLIAVPEERLGIRFEFNGNIYDKEFVERVLHHVHRAFLQIVENPETEIDAITLLSAEEQEQLLHQFNQPMAEETDTATIHQLFQKQVEKTPEAVALIGPNRPWLTEEDVSAAQVERETLTYRQLNEKANRLAHLLRAKGIGRDSVVAVMVERSFDMIISMLAALKAGGAYLPVDPQYPQQRILAMLADSGIPVLLSKLKVIEEFDLSLEALRKGDDEGEASGESSRREVLLLDQIEPALMEEYPGHNPQLINQPEDLLYVIYTSGSTGIPKGVMLEHRNLTNLMRFQYEETNIDFSRVLQFTTMSFDVSFQEIFSTLLAGGTLSLIDKETQADILRLLRVVREDHIVTLFLPASFLKFVMGEEDYIRLVPEGVRHIVTAGEQVVVSERFRRFLKENNVTLHNHYGPSETHVVTALTLEPSGEIPDLPPIGKPLPNTPIYIVDRRMQLQPIGVPGELLIGGVQVGRGYWNREDLTAEKFITDPFIPGQKVYRTGDLSRWLPDGTIEFLGRIDHQVKIRGFRIEPGEIENRLLSSSAVKEAAVITIQREGEHMLCAYIVPQEPDNFDVETIRYDLEQNLPDYMVPSFFVQMETIPLTPNRKLDKGALPPPDSGGSGSQYAAPGTETEKQLVAIAAEVLGLDKNTYSIDAGFFQLGGHSLKATILSSRVHKLMNAKLPLSQIFKTPTVRAMARFLDEAAADTYTAIAVAEKREYYCLSPAQKRIFILQQMDAASTVYNLPTIMTVSGDFDIERLEKAFKEVIKRHENLRTSFRMLKGEPIQEIRPGVPFNVVVTPLSEGNVNVDETGEGGNTANTSHSQLIKAFVRPFDLSKAPLLRVEVVALEDKRFLFMADIHHIISDGVSNGLFIKEFLAFYGGTGESLPEITIQYKDYAQWQATGKGREIMEKQEQYWINRYKNDIPLLNLPADFPRPPIQSFEGDVFSFQAGLKETRDIDALLQDDQVTLYMYLLAVFHVFLWKVSGQEDIIIGSPLAGRRHADLEPIIGMFVNTLTLRNRTNDRLTFREFLNQVKNSTLEAFENQDYPFEDLVEKVNIQRDAGRNPLFDVMFALQNMETEMVKAPDKNAGGQGVTVSPPEAAHTEEAPFKITPHSDENPVSKFDLSLYAVEVGPRIGFVFEYSTALFNKETIGRFKNYFANILTAVLQRPTIPLGEVDIMTQEERALILDTFNATDAPYPQDKTLQRFLEEHAEKSPQLTALIGAEHGMAIGEGQERPVGNTDKRSLTYEAFNNAANHLSLLLREKGVGVGSIVAVMMERSLEMMTALHAIIKAGGAYLPIDPHYPADRKTFILADSSAQLLVTAPGLLKDFSTQIPALEITMPQIHRLMMEENNGSASTKQNIPLKAVQAGVQGEPPLAPRRAPEGPRRAAGGKPRRTRRPCIYHIHLRFHRQSQRRYDSTWFRRQPHLVDAACLSSSGRGCYPAENPLCFRRLRMGIVLVVLYRFRAGPASSR